MTQAQRIAYLEATVADVTSACSSLTKGTYAYDFGDTAGLTPLMKMHTLGHDFISDPIHACIRITSKSKIINTLKLGFSGFVFLGAIQFARTEGIIPAPEPTHAIAATIREALRCKETGEAKVILMAMCGHGHFDLTSYDKYLQGELIDLSLSPETIGN